MSEGQVILVGAGPGDPGLITVRGREVLAQADLVLHDRLGTAELLPVCRSGAELVDAGKAPGQVAMTQDQINAALVEGARAGRAVVRLKGGDPFVFGRGGEEAEALAAAGVDFEVVPGITSALAAPAYAGIPVTHRGLAAAFTVVTGREDRDKEAHQTDWSALARAPGTLVILMGMSRIGAIRDALLAGGRPATQPAACVQHGTTSGQRSVRATLGDLPERVAAAGLAAPGVIVVGDVAGLDPAMGWFERRPLLGRSVVVTRARAQASALSERLRGLGADVVELPVIRIEPRAGRRIDTACDHIADYDLLVLTSVNGVDCLFDRLAERGRDARAVRADTTVVAIGPATAERLAERGVRADVVPKRFLAEGILAELAGTPLSGRRVLVARAREARPELVEGLVARGARVDEVALYDTRVEDPGPERLRSALGADYLTFTASSTVRRLIELVGDGAPSRLSGARVVSIGPVTSAAARDAGLAVHAEADRHDIPGLVDALVADAAATG